MNMHKYVDVDRSGGGEAFVVQIQKPRYKIRCFSLPNLRTAITRTFLFLEEVIKIPDSVKSVTGVSGTVPKVESLDLFTL